MNFIRKHKIIIFIICAVVLCGILFVLTDYVREENQKARRAEAAALASRNTVSSESVAENSTSEKSVSQESSAASASAASETVSASSESLTDSSAVSSSSSDHIEGFDPEDWRLILVNKTHYLPENYTVQTTDLDEGIYAKECSNGTTQQVDSRIYVDLTRMLQDCLDAGFTPVVCSGYRTHDKQIYLFQHKISDVEYVTGLSEPQAEEEAATEVAEPGTSEHELGLAVDIYCRENLNLDESQADAPTQQWLMAHSWEYGFVLRYPKDKINVTGITYEPWHYRYVGIDAAKVMHDRNLCLEEFVQEIS